MSSDHIPASTFWDFARSVVDWTLDDWLAWPPDVFVLTSSVLSRTGCYRFVLAREWVPELGWQGRVEAAAHQWTRSIDAELSARSTRKGTAAAESLLTETCATIERLGPEVTLDRLRVLDTAPARELAGALLTLHAIADEACSGFGLPGSISGDIALARVLADLLLVATGSLSSLPKQHGIVLPKLRTPQAGLTLRSMSHHLTYHSTEVEVMWRALPWPNIEENTVNILAIPWPPEVHPHHFHPEPETFGSVRYFCFNPMAGVDPLPVDQVVELITRANRLYCRVHVVVFPESSLTAVEYQELLGKLRLARWREELHHVPMIIAGVRNDEGKSGPINEVRLAAYFAERWYELTQRKHHRWKLDRNQIRQYGLEGRLATARSWYEKISLLQRRLTFLVPNGWLSLTPLICEDLAQLEPVSELIRGVGPTLLIALLSDGPQLKERWSGRYASVFADDPGTAVLTLTSAGMVAQARPPDAPPEQAHQGRTVALWKDQIRGWKPIDLEEGMDAILLTVSADWTEEFTADGRSDHRSAAVFKYEGVRQLALDTTIQPASAEDQEVGDRSKWLAKWGDIRELTAATFVLDAVLQLDPRKRERVIGWMLGRDGQRISGTGKERLAALIRRMSTAQKDPGTAGVAGGEVSQKWPTEGLRWAAETMTGILTAERGEENYWRWLVDEAISRLRKEDRLLEERGDGGSKARAAVEKDSADRQRINRAVPIAVLTEVHGRIEAMRRRRAAAHAAGGGSPQKRARPAAAADLDVREATRLLTTIEDALREYGY